MDPDASLKRLLDALRRGHRKAACEALMDLLDWISQGGVLPMDPRLYVEHLRVAAKSLIEAAENFERYAKEHTNDGSDG
jgi:hypothetical protein